MVYFSPVPWMSFSQRSHKFVEWFNSVTLGKVLWVDPYPARFPSISDLRTKGVRTRSKLSGEMGVPSWLEIVCPAVLPVEPIPGLRFLNKFLWRSVLWEIDEFLRGGDDGIICVGKPSLLSLVALRRNREKKSIYDAMDNFPAFFSGAPRKMMEKNEREIAKAVEIIIASSSGLASKFDWVGDKVFLCRNAFCSKSILLNSRFRRDKDQIVFGYVGTIGAWFDWDLVIKIAFAAPHAIIKIIGPVYCPSVVALPKNVELLPPCTHDEAIGYMRQFDAGLIPFKINELTSDVDPIKYYEYRALGLPVLTSKFGEMSIHSDDAGVFFVGGEANLNNILANVIEYRVGADELEMFHALNTWKFRFDSEIKCAFVHVVG